ncbi:MAG: response regulator [Chloroflexota bacterium]
MKVLYVEDNPANVALVKRVARMGNHEIINYIDGDKAIAKFNEINPDLVLMDIQLAGSKSGLDVVRHLRAQGVTTTIIAVTAYAMVGDKERALEAGCDEYLPKPLPIPRLVEIFKEFGDKVAQRATVPETTTPEPAPTPIAENMQSTDTSAPTTNHDEVTEEQKEVVAEASASETVTSIEEPTISVPETVAVEEGAEVTASEMATVEDDKTESASDDFEEVISVEDPIAEVTDTTSNESTVDSNDNAEVDKNQNLTDTAQKDDTSSSSVIIAEENKIVTDS